LEDYKLLKEKFDHKSWVKVCPSVEYNLNIEHMGIVCLIEIFLQNSKRNAKYVKNIKM
jgi:hypothetical protein